MLTKLRTTPSVLDVQMKSRHEATLDFIGPRRFEVGLDIGPPNLFTPWLNWLCDVVSNTEGDLDRCSMAGSYDVVFCFEVIEHVMNPLLLLDNIAKVLLPDGVVFLSTPLRPHFLETPLIHFHEFDLSRLRLLLEKSHLRVIRQKKLRLKYPLRFHLTGIRPFLRFFLDYCIILELTHG